MSILLDPRLRAWERTVPKGTRDDLIWRFHTYRVALYLLHLVRGDVCRVRSGMRWREVSEQLLRAAASISANVAEGYGRSTPADRARFYDMALGSVRETVSWYEASRVHLAEDLVDSRVDQLAELRRMLYGSIRALRKIPPGQRIA